MIRNATPADAIAVCQIYNHYVQNTAITFEEQPVSVEEMQKRILDVTSSWPWLVYEDHEQLLGYAYARQWIGRYAYRFCVESTIYLAPDATGRPPPPRLGR